MKKILLSVFLLFLFAFSGFSQDVITKSNGDEILAKILEVTQNDVKYRKFDQQNGPIFTISKAELLMVKYENGSKDVFNSQNKKNFDKSDSEALELKAREDAKMNYRGQKSGAGWTAAATFVFSPVLGIIPAAICSSSEPDKANLNIKDPELMKSGVYDKAYTEQAHKIKKKKVWTSFGIGSGAWVLILLLL